MHFQQWHRLAQSRKDTPESLRGSASAAGPLASAFGDEVAQGDQMAEMLQTKTPDVSISAAAGSTIDESA